MITLQPGVPPSVRNLMELMLRISDDSVTDVLLRTAGGGRAVSARLAALVATRPVSVERVAGTGSETRSTSRSSVSERR